MARKTGGKRRRTVAGIEYHHGKWRWRKLEDGRRHTIPLLASTEDEAIAEVLSLRKKPLTAVAGSWDSFVDAYLLTLSGNTRESRGAVLKAIGREMALRTPRSLTPAVAGRWLARLQARAKPSGDAPPEIAPNTVHHYVRDLRAFVKWAVARHHLPQDPTGGFSLPAQEEKLRDVWVAAPVILQLLQDARDAGDRDMEFILGLGFECSMRRGEIDACRPEWFDLGHGIVRIPPFDPKHADGSGEDWKRKGREGRSREAVIPLSDVMKEMIGRHGLPSPFIVNPTKEWGSHRYRFEFRNRFDKFMSARQLAHVTIHDMRRSFASNRVSAGVSLEKVANWMGITLRTAWKRYARFLPADPDINKGSAAAPVPIPPAPAPAPAADIAGRLAKLEELHAAGLITKAERSAKRAAILSEL